MYETPLSRRLGALRAWRQSRLQLIEQLRPWLQRQGLEDTSVRRALDQAADTLRDDRVTVAILGEFSRGKTELLNALFFADLGCRLLPSDVGRTTMCPTEIFHDPACSPQLRLLPIETRAAACSLAELRADPSQWQVFPLQLDDSDALAATLQRLTEQQSVTHAQATALGLTSAADAADVPLSIPRWRLAELNIPHPLLKRGLRVLDTPGLNAIGSEPELTFEMLPAAHAVLFVLGADTGVTRSDLAIWQRFVRGPAQPRRRGLMVVLNKTDTLWDELRSPGQITASIVSQCRSVATALDVGNAQIFAVSAQKALLARIKGNASLESRSGITGLERALGDVVADEPMRLIRDVYTRHVLHAVDSLAALIDHRLRDNIEQRRGLLDLASRSDAAIVRLLHATQHDFDQFQTNVDAFRRRLKRFAAHANKLLAALDGDAVENKLTEIHRGMTGAWTTIGLRGAMRQLFDDLDQRVETAGIQAQLMRRQLRSTYRHFETEYRIKVPPPHMLSIVRSQVELSLLDQEAEIFRNSTRTTLTEQHFVTRRYFDTIVTRVRAIVREAHDEARHWAETVMAPLVSAVTSYRRGLAQRIEDLKATARSRRTIQHRIDTLRRDSVGLQDQLAALQRVRQTLTQPEARHAGRASGQN